IDKTELYAIVSNTSTEIVIAGIISDPGLVGYKFFDFRLRGGVPGLSTAIDAGTAEAPALPTVDITSQPRTGSIDMGAYEFVDTDSDGIADWWEEKFGFDPLVADADLDPDTDTFTNLFEYAGNASPVNDDDVPGSSLFVDCTTGDDAAGTGAAALPFQSITRALATANTGQIIEVASGEYLAGNLVYNAADDTYLIGPESAEGAVATSYLGTAVYIDDDGISGFTAGDSMWVDSNSNGQYDEASDIELNGSPQEGDISTGAAKNVVFIDSGPAGIDADDSTWIDRGGLIPDVSVYVTAASGSEATIIDAQARGRAIVFQNGEDRNCIFNDFTLRNGDMTGGQGGAVYCVNNSDPVFINCSFLDNVADFGGAVYAESSPRFEDCTFDANQANFGGAAEFSTLTCHAIVEQCTVLNNIADDMDGDGGGGGFKIAGIANVRIENTEFYSNKAAEDGGAIMVVNATTTILNCTIVENAALNGRALYGDTAEVTIYNSILYTADGDGSEIYDSSDSVNIDFCIVRGGFAGAGAGSQISTADPQFIDALNNNFELDEGSPAIDQGDIATALQLDKRDRQRIDDLSVGNSATAGDLAADLGVFERSVLFVNVNLPGNDGNDGTSGSPLLTIQEALARATGGTSVIVVQGVYAGAGNFDLDFLGKAVSLTSQDGPAVTIIDASGGRGAWFRNGETDQSVFEGFTITNGSIDSIHGGGILCSNYSSPTLRNLRICDNEALGSGFGGGIACIESSHPQIETCTISVNNGAMGGGGIYLNKSSPVIDVCMIVGNLANTHAGGGILTDYSEAIIRNSLISGNVVVAGDKLGGGIAATNGSTLSITNCTISYNDNQGGAGAELYTDVTSPVEMYNTILWDPDYATTVDLLDDNVTSLIEYCNVPGETLTGSNISQDPLLIRTGEPGTWRAAVPSGFITTLTRDSGTWVPDELVGIIVNPNSTQSRGFRVLSNDSTSLTVWGDAT
ncbi:MAG: right-handed parallel beta-helix repeat-containing protein, partial [Lentisphaeria bacterium]|nr:right-handed parallel beta-helix repeat-containing protein [Lentisphaeria bacterium]